MIEFTKRRVLLLIRIDFIRFCIVGGTGFVINLAILTFMHNVVNAPIFLSQLVGAEIALFSNFMLHNYWTYKHRKTNKSRRRLLVEFHATTWPAIVGSTLMVSLFVSLIHMSSTEALVLSSLIALGWNFAWSKYVIWKDVTAKNIEEIAQ